MQTSIWYDPMVGSRGQREFMVIPLVRDMPFLGHGDRQTIKLIIDLSQEEEEYLPWEITGRFRQLLHVSKGTVSLKIMGYPSMGKDKNRDKSRQEDLELFKKAMIWLPSSLQ